MVIKKTASLGPAVFFKKSNFVKTERHSMRGITRNGWSRSVCEGQQLQTALIRSSQCHSANLTLGTVGGFFANLRPVIQSLAKDLTGDEMQSVVSHSTLPTFLLINEKTHQLLTVLTSFRMVDQSVCDNRLLQTACNPFFPVSLCELNTGNSLTAKNISLSKPCSNSSMVWASPSSNSAKTISTIPA